MLHDSRSVVSRSSALLFALFLACASSVSAQVRSGVLRVSENLRAEPNGVVVAVLEAGLPVQVVRDRGNWVEVIVEGWIWERSLRARDGGNFDFQVSLPEGENLRDEPQGAVLGRMEEGALLVELDRRPGWIRVRRQAWMWAPSVELSAAPSPAASGGSQGVAGPPAPRAQGVFRSGSGTPVLTSPDGDTLALLQGGQDLQVTAREGNWARVRLDGWVWAPPVAEALEEGAAPAEPGLALTVAEVRRNPETHVGRLVTWEVQFVSLEQAEAVRTDFYEGEPFLLTRPGNDPGTRFVYVAVPPEQMGVAEGLIPLETVTIVGRVRTGASALTGAPILDLVELRRSR